MLGYCWISVEDDGPTITQHWDPTENVQIVLDGSSVPQIIQFAICLFS